MDINHNFSSIQQITGQYLNSQKTKQQTMLDTVDSFEKILKKQQESTGNLKFSKHADNRLAQRNITLTGDQMQRLEDGTERARNKGIKESLVMVDEMAFIVNVKNNTVITAMSQEEQKDAVFTNIDGAVII